MRGEGGDLREFGVILLDFNKKIVLCILFCVVHVFLLGCDRSGQTFCCELLFAILALVNCCGIFVLSSLVETPPWVHDCGLQLLLCAVLIPCPVLSLRQRSATSFWILPELRSSSVCWVRFPLSCFAQILFMSGVFLQ
jgi:hypothetical protein